MAIITPKLSAVTSGAAPLHSRVHRCPDHLDDDDEQQAEDAGRGERLELAMAVRMRPVGRPLRNPHGDEREDVGPRIGERVKAVGEDADRAGPETEPDLGAGDDQIENQDVRARTRVMLAARVRRAWLRKSSRG